MKIKEIINGRLIQVVGIMVAFAFAQPVMAVCIQSDPPADPVLAIDANNGCDDIQGQEGCHIKNVINGTCTYTDSNGDWFTVYSDLNQDGSLSWSLDPASTLSGIDTAMIGGGAKGKNNCGYSYKFDVASGSGGDCKAGLDVNGNCTGAFQNITGLDVCTDGLDEVPPPPPVEPPVATTLKSCQPDSSIPGALDDTGIICPTYDDPLDTANFGKQKPVIVCNLEVDKYAFGTIGANEAVNPNQEEVCCKCGITGDTACFISETKATNVEDGIDLDTGCTVVTSTDPTQEVILQFQKDRGTDPCQKIRSGGKVYKTCW